MSDPSTFSLFKRSNGVYYVKYCLDEVVRWKSTGCTLKTEALRTLTEFEQLCKVKSPSVSLAQFTKDYLAYSQTNHTPGTFEICSYVLEQFQAFLGDCPLNTITPKHADLYKSMRLSSLVVERKAERSENETRKTVSPVTVNIELRTLRAAFAVALRWKLLEVSPFEYVQLAKVPEQAPSFFSKGDFERLLAIVKEQWLRELIFFAVATGMRRNEILHLRWQDIDLSRKVIQIQSNGTYRTKQGKRRTIPMSDLVEAMLVAKSGRLLSEYVFTRKGRKIGESFVTHRFKKYVRLAKLDDRLHWHSLRHTHASWLVQCGVSLYEVQKLLGHSSSKITEVYSHLQPEQLHNTVNRIKLSLN